MAGEPSVVTPGACEAPNWHALILPNPTAVKLDDPKVVLGKGANGEVCRGEYEGNPVAVKKLFLLDLSVSPRERDFILQEFTKECLTLSRVQSPFVVKIFGISIDAKSDPSALIMELLLPFVGTLYHQDGESRSTRIPLVRFVWAHVGYEVLCGLEFLEQHNVVHRDLKPSNLLVTKTMHIKIGDFGEGRFVDPNRTNTVGRGTALYLPPEARRPKQNASSAHDRFQYGVMMMELTLGTIPDPGPEQDPDGKAMPETERRRNEVARFNVLLPHATQIVESLLSDKPDMRAKIDDIYAFYNSELSFGDDWNSILPADLLLIPNFAACLVANMETRMKHAQFQLQALRTVARILDGAPTPIDPQRGVRCKQMLCDAGILQRIVATIGEHCKLPDLVVQGLTVLTMFDDAACRKIFFSSVRGSVLEKLSERHDALLLRMLLPSFDQTSHVIPLASSKSMSPIYANIIHRAFIARSYQPCNERIQVVETLTMVLAAESRRTPRGFAAHYICKKIVHYLLVPDYLEDDRSGAEYYRKVGHFCCLLLEGVTQAGRLRWIELGPVARTTVLKIMREHSKGDRISIDFEFVPYLLMAEYALGHLAFEEDNRRGLAEFGVALSRVLQEAVPKCGSLTDADSRNTTKIILHTAITVAIFTKDAMAVLNPKILKALALFFSANEHAGVGLGACVDIFLGLTEIPSLASASALAMECEELLVMCMSAFPYDEGMQSRACATISKIGNRMLPTTSVTRLVERVVAALQYFSNKPAVLREACSALYKITDAAGKLDHLRSAGVAGTVLHAMNVFPDDVSLQKGACSVLALIVTNETQYVEEALKAVRRDEKDAELQCQGLEVLWKATLSGGHRKEGNPEFGWTEVVHALELHSGCLEVVTVAFAALLSMLLDDDWRDTGSQSITTKTKQALAKAVCNAVKFHALNELTQLNGIQILDKIGFPSRREVVGEHHLSIFELAQMKDAVKAAATAFPRHRDMQTHAANFIKKCDIFFQ